MDEPFLPVLRRVLGEYRAPSVEGLPRFAGGAVGYMGYDAAALVEPAMRRAAATSGITSPDADAAFMLFDTVMAFDHVQHRLLLIANARVRPGVDLRTLYDFASTRLDFLQVELERALSRPAGHDGGPGRVRWYTSRPEFEDAVRTAQAHIAAGDVFQVVLSRRADLEVQADPFLVYRALRHVSPAPYMFFLRIGPLAIAGASPEMLVRVEGRHVETHPIAGTRPRAASPPEDARLAEQLVGDAKERAEHTMLVDLGRNDLGRVCEYGSVCVPRFMTVERFSHVMHLASRVEGTLRPECDRLDALAACFPAGTVTGAPKIRAMQIIDALEPSPRGIYAGAVGYLDFAGNLDCCIAIRTITMRAGRATLQAGAGIVADSDPGAEFDETENKARALERALELAHGGGW